MLQIQPNSSLPCQPGEGPSYQKSISFKIRTAEQQGLKELLGKYCLTESLLCQALSRDGIKWSSREQYWINQRIKILQQSQIEQEIDVPYINSITDSQYLYTGAQGGARSVLPIAVGAQKLTQVPTETSQSLNHSVRGDSAYSHHTSVIEGRRVTCASQQSTPSGATQQKPKPESVISQEAQENIRNKADKTDGQIAEEISSMKSVKILDLLHFQPMSKVHLLSIQNNKNNTIGIKGRRCFFTDAMNISLTKRIDRLAESQRESSTPYLRKLYHEKPAEFNKNMGIIYSPEFVTS